LLRAAALFRKPEVWRKLMLRAMAQDFSWTGAAQDYMALYAQAVEARKAMPRLVSAV
jgi:starch synthase